MPKLKKPSRDEISAYRARLNERVEAGALRYPFAITEIRKTMGLTQEMFAKITGLTRRQIAEIERNEANPTVDTLNKIGKIFGFTVGFVKRTPREEEPASAFHNEQRWNNQRHRITPKKRSRSRVDPGQGAGATSDE